MKVFGVYWRAAQLARFCLSAKPQLGLSHGSRSQAVICNILRIATIFLTDYEHAREIFLNFPRWLILPDVIPGTDAHVKPERIRYYRGIKEDVYAREFVPDLSLPRELGLISDSLIITVRPPATEAHYHNPEADLLLSELMERVCQTARTQVILLPRNRAQEQSLRKTNPKWFINRRTIVPGRAVDGLNLLWHSDLVVSGGGTMNREAAALGVPVYSIFRGAIGAVDRMLEKEGRLVLINSPQDIWAKVIFAHRDRNQPPADRPRPALEDIMRHIEEIALIESRSTSSLKRGNGLGS
jgi:hypothetical protein